MKSRLGFQQIKNLLAIFFIVLAMSVFAQSDTVKEKLVEIGYGHQLFMSEQGLSASLYTIVFESGGGGGAKDWEKVRALLPASIRTIAYDRAGTGKSPAGCLPRSFSQEVFELHALLDAAGTKGPIILVGQSIGGLLVRMYAERYGKDVAGIVLVDPTNESSMLGSMKYGGWVRLREKAIGKPVPHPQLKKNISPGYDSTADYMAEAFQKIYLARQEKPQALKERPLIVIGAGIRDAPPGTPDEQWKTIRAEKDKQVKDLTSLSANAKFILDPASRHNIQNDNPAIVAQSIQTIIESIRLKTKL